ncbi:phosphomannomutase/phosphoglucomutase [Chloroflexota bacterium]
MANLTRTMFREYDIRGLVSEEQINEFSVALISRAYGTMLVRRGIESTVVGYDLRTGSKELSEVAIEGLLATGVNVIAIGQVLTPIMYAAQYHFETKGGMMVTASHNPNGWLGFKLALGYSYTLGPDEIKELYDLTVSEEFSVGEGARRDEDYIPIYAEDILGRIDIPRSVKVVVNAGNGTAGPIVPDILRRAGCEVVEFLTEPDLEYSHYFPNPSKVEMMEDTGQQTVKNQAEVGFAFDGDGDRLGVTDENGQAVWPDRFMAIIARQILEEYPGSPIIFDVKSSRALAEDIKAHGGEAVMWKTGHSYIKQKLHETKSPFAGEMSGHIFFGPPLYYGFDDAVFTALKMLEIIAKSEKTFSEMVAEVPTYISTPTLQVDCPDEKKYEIVAAIVQDFIDEDYDVVTFENNLKLGGRLEFSNGWGLIRASSNLPVLVLRFEATSDAELEKIKALVKEKMDQYEEIGDKWESG